MFERLREIKDSITTKKADSTPLLNNNELEDTRKIIRVLVEKHLELNPHLVENLYKPLLYSVEDEHEIVDVSPKFVGSWCVFPGEGEYHREFRGIFELKAKDLGMHCPPAFGRNNHQMRQREPIVRGIINDEIRNYIQQESDNDLSLEDLLEGQSADSASLAG